jgi:hypothetical protein
MGLLDGLTPVRDIEPCKVGRTILELEPDDQKVLVQALDNDQWTSRALSIALRGRGVILAKDTIHNHRTKTCRCSKI